jgi:hypothetical protein
LEVVSLANLHPNHVISSKILDLMQTEDIDIVGDVNHQLGMRAGPTIEFIEAWLYC